MRPCVIFNPAAKGEKARKFRKRLDQVAAQSVFKLTAAPGDARRLAAEAVHEGFGLIVAAGGDGTLHEVINGLGDVPEAFSRVRLGVMPLGTVNVFAREMGIPLNLISAWKVLSAGHERRIDLPFIEVSGNEEGQRHYFLQMAGAGLDARAIELVDYGMKRKVGALAYVLAGMQALSRNPSRVRGEAGDQNFEGQLILVGNGRRYGGDFTLFPQADLQDGLLDVCVFPRTSWLTLLRSSLPLALTGRLPRGVARWFRAESVHLTAEDRIPVEADGELLGQLPATIHVRPETLRVIVP